MTLIKEGRVAEDSWRHVGDEEPLPAKGEIIVSLTRWRADREALRGRNSPLGIRLRSDEHPSAIADELDRFELVALEFPAFKDGRAYSAARLLRERYGYTGELRAVGDVLRDQLQFMQRCGFDAFEYAGITVADDAVNAFDEIGTVYQTAADRRRSAAGVRNDRSAAFLNGTCG